MCQYDPKSALALYDFSCTQILEKISVRILVLKYSKKNMYSLQFSKMSLRSGEEGFSS